MQTIAILGSTGSIGTQALELVRLHPEEFRVVALTARSSREKLFEQVREFRPEVAGLTEPIPMSEIPEDVRFCRWAKRHCALRRRKCRRTWCSSAWSALPGCKA